MKAAIKSILKGVERVTDICSEILTYDPLQKGCWSRRGELDKHKQSEHFQYLPYRSQLNAKHMILQFSCRKS